MQLSRLKKVLSFNGWDVILVNGFPTNYLLKALGTCFNAAMNKSC